MVENLRSAFKELVLFHLDHCHGHDHDVDYDYDDDTYNVDQ